jgi:hypothetical protein
VSSLYVLVSMVDLVKGHPAQDVRRTSAVPLNQVVLRWRNWGSSGLHVVQCGRGHTTTTTSVHISVAVSVELMMGR